MSMVPRTYEPPGLFSTTSGTFNCSESCCVRMRISTSGEPPGADGMMKRIGFSGYAALAAAASTSKRAATSGRMPLLFIRRQRGEARIVDIAADREVIDRLERQVPEAEHLVHRVVVEAADARGAHAGGLRLQIEHLADGARFPVKAAVEPGARLDEPLAVFGDHAERERAVAGDVLLAAHLRRELARVARLQQIERQRLRAAGRPRPRELAMHAFAQELELRRIAREHVKAALDARHAMYEEREVDHRPPRQRVHPARTGEHPVKRRRADGCLAVAREEAAPLMNDLPGQQFGDGARTKIGGAWGEFGLRPRIPRLQRRLRDDVDDVPGNRLIAAQAIRGSVPALGRGRLVERERQRPLGFARPDGEHGFRVLALHAGVVSVAIEAEKPRDGRVRRVIEHERRPAERRRRDAQRADGVPDVVLAVAEGALAVFPRFAPMHRRESHQKCLGREAAHQVLIPLRRPFGPALERVLARRVMEKARRAELRQRDEHIAFGRMEVSARGIGAQRPAHAARLLPGGERKRVFEQPRKHAQRRRHRRHAARAVDRFIRRRARLVVRREARQSHERRACVAAKGIGLVRPVERARACGVAIEMVLGSLVIAQHGLQLGGGRHTMRHASPYPARKSSFRRRLQLLPGLTPGRGHHRRARQLQGRPGRDRSSERAAARQQGGRQGPEPLSAVLAHERRRLSDRGHRQRHLHDRRGGRPYERRARRARERHHSQRPGAAIGSRAALAGAALVLVARTAWCTLPDEIQVYTDDLERPGERGIELHVNTTPSGRATPDYPGEVVPHHGLRITPEISWGLARNWDAGLYLPFVRSAEGADFFAGPRFRLQWLPLKPVEGTSGAFAGVNWELSFVQQRFEQGRPTTEIRPIVGYRGDAWLFSFNPIITADLAGEDKGVLMFAPAAKISRAFSRGTALGAEYYAELGRLSHFAPRAEQSHILYAVIDTERVNFGIGRGLTDASDRWTIKAIFSF